MSKRIDHTVRLGRWVIQCTDAQGYLRTMGKHDEESSNEPPARFWDWGPSLRAHSYSTKTAANNGLRYIDMPGVIAWVTEVDEAYLIAAQLVLTRGTEEADQ